MSASDGSNDDRLFAQMYILRACGIPRATQTISLISFPCNANLTIQSRRFLSGKHAEMVKSVYQHLQHVKFSFRLLQ